MSDSPEQNITPTRRRVRRVEADSNSRLASRAKLQQMKAEKEDTGVITDLLMEKTVLREVESRQFDDPFDTMYWDSVQNSSGKLLPIEPPHNPSVLKRIPMESNILLQCVDAMVQNIEGTGYGLEYIGPDENGDGTEKEAPEVVAERNRIEAFLAAPNEEYSLEELRRRIRRDRETFGYAFFEVVRDAVGMIHAVYHIPAHTIRITAHDPEPVAIPYEVRRGDKIVKIKRNKRFRRFLQKDSTNARNIYFKEFGDPRTVHVETGAVSDSVPMEKRATELLMFTEYKSGYLYGVPRWINQLPSILGSRESEIVNLEFFRDNAIPAMAVLVAGGYLSEDSVDRIADMFNRRRGRTKMNEVLVIEAYGDEQAAAVEGQVPVPKIELKPLAMERQKDALFQEYDKECQRKIRSAFRLPPIILGLSDDYTYATADASMVVVESQVFQPERAEMDEVINKYFLGDGVNGPKYWQFKSNPTRIVDDKEVANSLSVLDQVGAMTPNDAIGIANQMFHLNIKPIPHAWGNYPYSMVMALLQKGDPILGLEELLDEAKILEQQQRDQELAEAALQQPKNNNNNKDDQEDAQKRAQGVLFGMFEKLRKAKEDKSNA